MTSKQPPVSTPSVIGTTTMPKKTLSYRWIINDAKVFLQNIDAAAGFKSPTFPLTLPLKDVSRQTINWHLLIKSRTTNYFSVSLCRGANGSKSKILISDCIFSLLRLENNTVKKSKVAPSTVIGSSTKDVSVSDFIVLSDLDDGALIIQVDAILLCFTDYCESIKTLEPPEDNIRDNIKSLQQDQHFSDLTITSGGKQFKVHKAILVSQSPVFQRMLAAEMAEKKRSSIVKMTDISPAALSDLVAYLYTGIAPNVNTNTLAKELLSAANKYELPRLLQICERELISRISASNVIEMLSFAEMHQTENLKRACLEYIKSNFDPIKKSDAWHDFKSKSTTSDSIYPTLVAEILEYCQCKD